MDNVLLYTPGIDSVLAKYAIKMQYPNEGLKLLYYDIKSKYSYIEKMLLKNKRDIIIYDDTFNFKEDECDSAYIPNRNLHMAMHAAKYGNRIFIGGTKSDNVSDNNENIMKLLSDILTETLNKKIIVTSPFWNHHKIDIAKWYMKQNSHDIDHLCKDTFSCYNPNPTLNNVEYTYKGNSYDTLIKNYGTFECQSCAACFRKSILLYSVGIYRKHNNIELVSDYLNKSLNKIKPNTRDLATISYAKQMGIYNG